MASRNPRSTFRGGSTFSGLHLLKNPLLLRKNPLLLSKNPLLLRKNPDWVDLLRNWNTSAATGGWAGRGKGMGMLRNPSSTFTGDSSFSGLMVLKNPLKLLSNPLLTMLNPGMDTPVDIPLVGWAQGMISEYVPVIGPAVGVLGVSLVATGAGAYLTGMLRPKAQELYAKIPYAPAADLLSQKIPATAAGALGATGLLLLNSYLPLGEYLGSDTVTYLSGGMVIGGAIMDIMAHYDIAALEKQAATNVAEASAAAGGSDGESAGVMNWYGDAMFGDAMKGPRDFSPKEGTALVSGPAAWKAAFSEPSMSSGMRDRYASKHAGKPGHGWGWLIKRRGFQGAAKIAAMPPTKRIKHLDYERKLAAQSLSQIVKKDVANEDMGGLMSIGNVGAI